MNEIEVIWKFLDNLDEYVYATDIETDELVYMNRKLLEVYGLQSIDDVKGMKCYEVLQKSSVPCGMCNNDRLCAGKFVEWRYYNPVIDKYMMLKDTLVEDPVTNKKYRIEISIDISEERSQDKMIQKYRDMESFVNEALKDTSVVVASYDIGDGMRGVIGVVGPTRMDYAKVTARLSYFADSLTRMFGKGELPAGGDGGDGQDQE